MTTVETHQAQAILDASGGALADVFPIGPNWHAQRIDHSGEPMYDGRRFGIGRYPEALRVEMRKATA